MTEERKNEIIKTAAYMSADKLIGLFEAYVTLRATNVNTSEEAEYVLQTIKTEIRSRMSM